MLSLEHISAGYGGFQALFDVSLDVNAGEAVAVIGPNGAGKTTLLRVISKLLPPSGGKLVFNNESLNNLPSHEILERGIAHVPENRRLFPRLTVYENLKIGAFPPEARKHFDERLERVYGMFPILEKRKSQAAGTLSGGEQQMCAIGRALMSGPKLLLLDEPSAGLAPVVVQAIFELVRKICTQGYTVLIVEQNIRQVLKVVSRAYLLDAGKIKMEGSSQKLLQSEEIRKAYLGL